ncbi:hypothetical protein KFL_003120160 [Klebsormidium nitens]|uniref:SWIM-type domain-containing protein n=1 Tax=Klebsormidium nitens TaxID=105231 RepID=A0A1Y1I783_KLENI|nr:hypothetical protein KFL_003120160 [Klebsormidium nitens]|eukprot:GAQ86810.1 hypothetical protein KFL_003120160 [Klebsormidium nitens]
MRAQNVVQSEYRAQNCRSASACTSTADGGREQVPLAPASAPAAGTPSAALLQAFHPATLKAISRGDFVVDPKLLSLDSLASKCALCKQSLIRPNANGCELDFRKGQELKGFAVSDPSSRVKGQRKEQPVCLECVKNLIGPVSTTSTAATVVRRGWVGPAEVWFERTAVAEPWRQVKVLLGEDVVALQAKGEEARLAIGGRRASTAAEAALNRGRKVGEAARKPLAASPPCASSTDARDAEGRLTIAAQAAKFLAGIKAGQCVFYSIGEEDSTSSVYLATTWDHNAARPKPLGRPSKARALLETVYWDTSGAASCTCDRGRLFFGAPCVHKLALQALEGPRQASHISLQRGARVVEAPCSKPGERVFGVYWNAASPSPHRTMVHFGASEQFPWYCEGRQSGCSKTTDCSHILEAKRALQRPDGIHRVSGCLFSEAQLERALVSVYRGEGDVQVEAGEAAARGAHERCAAGAQGPAGDQGSPSVDASAELEAYLLELVIGGHHEATCKGEICFCKQHPRLFGGIDLGGEACASRCCSSASASGKRARSEQVDGGEAGGARGGVKRRSKAFWAARERDAAEPMVADGARSCKDSEVEGCSGVGVGRRGEVMVPVCTSCACPSRPCTHGASGRVAVVLPMEAEAVQVEIPKLVRPVDSWDVHDPEVTLLRQPVKVSELVARDFAELSTMECLSAPCPRAPPRCKTKWIRLWQSAHIYSLQWSQEVKVRIFCCTCPEKHTVHFNGEALGLFAWTRAVIVTQASCQLLLRSIQESGSASNGFISACAEARRQYKPSAVLLSEETWRKASLGFFRLCGRSILECCSICGLHPKVLLCDGLAGLACADGGRQKGGLSGTSAAAVRPFTAPSQDSAGVNVEKTMEAGVNFCAASLEGRGMKRRLVIQPELRTLLARFSGHHPRDPELGKSLAPIEYQELLVALERADVEAVSDFVPDPDDADADPVLLHWRRRILMEQTGQIRSKNQSMFELLDGIEREALRENPRWPPLCPGKWSELLYGLGAPLSVSDDSNLIQHGRALAVVRKLLLGGAATGEDKATLAEHAPVLRRLLDHYGDVFPDFFMPALHHLYRLTLFGRGACGLGVDRAGWALSAIEGLDHCVSLARDFRTQGVPPNAEQREVFRFWEARANDLLAGVESLTPPAPQQYPLSPAELRLLNGRLGLETDGSEAEALPPDHPFCKEQRELGCYPLPGWEQKRPLPQYRPFEDELGRSVDRREEHRCRSGLTVGEFDAEIAAKSSVKSAKRLRQHTKGGFVFCCPHRVIYGWHVMLRGESPRDPFTVLYTRLTDETFRRS